ncbi:ribosomal protein S18-alanine N-acetyltransferase [Sphingomonas sp. RB56-2]|uniref:[Ribosomal protein bS18]-alanine N-acetyltransferase n=1 Tax=Sphingomonas brevis TaxID=2908206 RepID=A0ABT0S927_9SPHN|nr:ribosomal protein S18-alanine N-acetyltransferase [Sphingomonas brevis]MCL6740911.1 ribosomal protein S18-alanine N-acetyltransferase [Sphingomonas brevis]
MRRGGADELDEVMEVMTAAFQPCFGEAWTRSQCAGILPMHGVSLTLAEQGGQVAGFSLVRAVADEAELLLLAVDPSEQRRGIGQALLDDFIATALAGGAHRLHLEVRDGNPAVELYCTSGFSQVGRRRNYYHGPDGQSHDAVTLALVD